MGLFNVVSKAASGSVAAVSNTTNSATHAVTNTTQSVTNAVSNTTQSATNAVSNTTQSATNAVSNTTQSVTNAVSNTTQSATNAVSNTTQSATNAVSNTTQSVTNAVSNTTQSVTDAVTNTTHSVTSAALNTTHSVTDALTNSAESVASATFNTIHTGTDIAVGLTQAATGYVFNVTETAALATANTGKTFVSELTGTTQGQLQNIVDSVNEGIAQVGSGIDNSVTAVQNIVVSGVQTVGSGVETVTDAAGGALSLTGDALHLQINPGDYLAYIGSVVGDVGATISDARAFVDYTLTAAQGGGFNFGNSDGLLGINIFASLIGNGTDVTNVIPDYRGSNGFIPFNFATDGHSVLVGAELPFTPLLMAALPILAPVNTGGIGIVTVFDPTGFDVKLYTVAGPSVNIGPLNIGATTEVGNYSQINLLSWHGLGTGDLPIAGGLLGSIPLVNSLSVPVPSLDLGIESQVYSQSILNLSAFGIGPKAQVELVNSLNNDVAIVSSVVIPTIDSAAGGISDVLQAILLQDGGSSAPAGDVPVQIVGNDVVSDNGLWAA